MSLLFTVPKATPIVGGAVSPGAKAHFHLTGTTTNTNTYSDAALTVAHANPVIADAAGVFPTIYLSPDITYRLILNDSSDALIYDEDPIGDALTQANIGLIFYPRNAAEITAGVTPTNYEFNYDDARRDGAALDATDDTAEFATRLSVHNQTVKMYGTSAVADLTLTTQAIDGQNIGKFTAFTGATDVLVKNAYTGDSWHYTRIKDLEIDATGDTIRTVNAISLDRAGDHLAAGLIVDGCYIQFADKGINKPNGSIGDQILTTTVKNCNYGYFATDTTGPIQHVGANRIQGGEWSGNKKAAMYLDTTQNSGQTIIDGAVIEANVAHGIYVENYNLAPTAFELRNVWFENNNTGATTIDLGFGNGSETPRDVLFRNVDHAIITGCHVTSTGMQFINSMVTLDGCFFNATSVLVQDANSVVRCMNANLDGIDSSSDVIIESITQQRRNSLSGVNMAAQILPRTHIVKVLPGTGVGVYSNTMDHSPVNFTGATGVRTAGGGNSGLYSHHQRVTTAISTIYVDALAAVVNGKWYVYTVDMMVEAAEDLSFVSFDGSGGLQDLAVGFDDILFDNITAGNWVTMGGVAEYTDTTGNVRFRFSTTGADNPFVNVGPAQIIQFDTQKEATDYFNILAFWQGAIYDYNGVKTLSSGTAAVDFTDEGEVDQPDALYNIELTGDSSTTAFYSSKAVTGFTINGGTTDTVNWRVYRRDL